MWVSSVFLNIADSDFKTKITITVSQLSCYCLLCMLDDLELLDGLDVGVVRLAQAGALAALVHAGPHRGLKLRTI